MTRILALQAYVRWLAIGASLVTGLAGLRTSVGAATATMFRYSPSHAAELAGPPVGLGGLAWRFTTGAEVRSTPAVADGLAVFGSNDGFLYAVEGKTGVERWKANLGGAITSSPAIAQGLILVMGHDGRLHARKLADGSQVWTLTTGLDLSLGDDPRSFDLWDSSPTVVGETVFAGSGDGKVYAADLATGRERWSHATGSRVPGLGGHHPARADRPCAERDDGRELPVGERGCEVVAPELLRVCHARRAAVEGEAGDLAQAIVEIGSGKASEFAGIEHRDIGGRLGGDVLDHGDRGAERLRLGERRSRGRRGRRRRGSLGGEERAARQEKECAHPSTPRPGSGGARR